MANCDFVPKGLNIQECIDACNNETEDLCSEHCMISCKNCENDSKIQLGTKLGANNASIPFKIDKYNENSESYIISSYYFISLLTMSFFIYKQLKQ